MPPLIANPNAPGAAEPSLAERALQAIGPLQEQYEATKPGFGDYAKLLIPLVGSIFAGQLNQKLDEHRNVEKLQEGLAQSLTQQGLYHLLPAVHGKLTSKSQSEMLANLSLANAAAKRPYLDAVAAKNEFMQQGQQPEGYGPAGALTNQFMPQKYPVTPLEGAAKEAQFAQTYPDTYAVAQHYLYGGAAKDILDYGMKARGQQLAQTAWGGGTAPVQSGAITQTPLPTTNARPATSADIASLPASMRTQVQSSQIEPFQVTNQIAHKTATIGEGGFSTHMETIPADQQAAAYMQRQIQRIGYAGLKPAMEEVLAKGVTPNAEQLKQISSSATMSAYQAAKEKLAAAGVTEPDLHTRAVQAAAQVLGGFFNDAGLASLQNPVALKQAEAGAGVIGAAGGKAQPIYTQGETVDIGLAGKKAGVLEGVKIGAELSKPGQRLAQQRIQNEVQKSAQEHEANYKVKLGEVITDPSTLAGLQLPASATYNDISRKQLFPLTSVQDKDVKEARQALAAIRELEDAYKKTGPLELGAGIAGKAKHVASALQLNPSVTKFEAIRSLFMENLGAAVAGMDKRFTKDEQVLLSDSIPQVGTQKSVANKMFMVMRNTIMSKYVNPTVREQILQQGQAATPINIPTAADQESPATTAPLTLEQRLKGGK